MHKELLSQTPLLALPLLALFLFIFVFAAETVRAMRRTTAEVDHDASLPLSEDESHDG
jgi:hypothetical protein